MQYTLITTLSQSKPLSSASTTFLHETNATGVILHSALNQESLPPSIFSFWRDQFVGKFGMRRDSKREMVSFRNLHCFALA